RFRYSPRLLETPTAAMATVDNPSTTPPSNLDAVNGSPNGAESGADNGSMVSPKKRGGPEGLWLKCPGCSASVYRKEVERRANVCPKCEYHFYVSARERIAQVLDEATFEPMDEHLRPTDPLEFC